ncbi:MAG: cbb3-type cytochrome c oxidase subunit II [Geopsychrobacter sp.]|nr:cbb3-type cytochrome c oxidase subunit II [Geopsychrobacter sp.]
MWEKRPFLLLILATVVIMIGTTVTMIVPFLSINTDEDRIASVKPYTPLQQEGRDIYMREGCNNCHTQTVRPLVSEVLRYGEYSKSGEFVYDRPFLWGSKRTGPDLARLGGKYPDAWHYKHMESPRTMIPGSNMPDYGWIKQNALNPQMIQHKMDVLDFPYTAKQISALADKNEMDAIVAYLQKLGSDIPWRKAAQTTIVGELKNPFIGDRAAITAGQKLFANNCAPCHGDQLEGGIGPELTDLDMDDDDLYETIHNGISDGGMPAFGSLGSNKVWQLVNFLKARDND